MGDSVPKKNKIWRFFMFVVMEQVFVLFAFSLAGYLLSKCGLANVSHDKL